ncbi:MAG: ABC transporter permease [Chloroflexota bacterium]|nr:ABC transporter permease [Chloroflexota bacterium]
MIGSATGGKQKQIAREEASGLVKWSRNNRRAITSTLFLIVMLIGFTMANPEVFSQFKTYRSVMIALPVSIFLVVPLVFVVTAGEIDLSFPSVVGLASYAFVSIVDQGGDPLVGISAALLVGAFLGFLNGILVVRIGLSALVATLGMNFFLRGLINILVEGFSIAIPEIRGSFIHTLLTDDTIMIVENQGIPNQMLWALAFTALGVFLYNRHSFGVRVHCVGDNPESAAEMGIDVDRTRILVFVFTGIGAALAGVFSVMINFVWWPTTGDGLLLPVLAGLFVGGTPTWGGIGTVFGGAIGTSIVAFIETGVIAAGLTGFFTQFFYGLIIILSLIFQRFNGGRVR